MASIPGGKVVSMRVLVLCGLFALSGCRLDDRFGGGGSADMSAGGDAALPVICQANTALRCNGSSSVACNADGTAEQTFVCAGGCDASTFHCNDCVPNSSVCASGMLTVCSAGGTVTRTDSCALGCATSGDRCKEIDPANGVAAEMDGATTAPDVVFNAASVTTINADTGDITYNGMPFSIPSVSKPQAGGNPSIRVFQVQSLKIQSAVKFIGANAVVIVSRGDVEIASTIEIAGRFNVPGPGARVTADGCIGGDANSNGNEHPGAGGGGFLSAGANGGSAQDLAPPTGGSAGGAISGTVSLEPLRGGCRGGNFLDPSWLGSGGGGGGALQVTSRTKVTVAATGIIDAGGGGAAYSQSGPGGGSGGGVLLEAPVVQLDGTVCANGGGGGNYKSTGENGQVAYRGTSLAAKGGDFVGSGIGLGGDGGTKDAPPGNGANAAVASAVSIGGGGGGAVGRIRINTASGTGVKGGASLLSPVPSEAMMKVR
jgi:hypothetical protein